MINYLKTINQHKTQLKCIFEVRSRVKKNDRQHVRLSGCVLAWGGRKAETLTAFTTQNVHFKIRDEEKSKIDRPCERYIECIQLLIQFKLCRTYYLPPQKEIVLVVVTPNNLQLVCCSYTSSLCRFTLSGKLKRVFERPLFFYWRKRWPIRTRAGVHTLNRNRTKPRWTEATKPLKTKLDYGPGQKSEASEA